MYIHYITVIYILTIKHEQDFQVITHIHTRSYIERVCVFLGTRGKISKH